MLRLQPLKPLLLVRPGQTRLGLFRQREEVSEMLVAPLLALAGFLQSVPGVLAHGLQKAIPGDSVPLLRD